jgi:hypothetical protein
MNYIAAEINFYPLLNSDDIVLTRTFQRSDWDANACLNVEVANDILSALNIKYQGSISRFEENVSVDDLLSRLKYSNNNEINRTSILFCTDFDNSEITDQWSTQSYNLMLKNMEDMKLEQQENERNYFEKEEKIEG